MDIKISSGKCAVLMFDLETHSEEFSYARDGAALVSAISDIHNEVWRPSWKHGYSDPRIAEIIKKIDEALEPLDLKDCEGHKLSATSLIFELHKKYREILTIHGVDSYY